MANLISFGQASELVRQNTSLRCFDIPVIILTKDEKLHFGRCLERLRDLNPRQMRWHRNRQVRSARSDNLGLV